MLNSALDAIVTVDEQQRVVLYNLAAEASFGWSRQEIMLQPLDRLMSGDFFKTHVQPLAQGSATSLRTMARGLRRNGEAFFLDASISRLETPAGKLFTVIVRDAAALAGLPPEVEFAAFSYSVSHGLRSPLNIINGFSHLLAKKLAASENPQVQHYLSRIQESATQMGKMIEALLALSQVSRTPLRSEPLDLSLMARDILQKCQAHEPGRRASVQIESGLQTHGDSKLVKMVMENLLDNAWKFTSQKAEAAITVGRQTGVGQEPVFFVRDNGAGFDMAYADKLFKPFQRLHAAPEFPGAGMGLATASRVIARHGGRLWAESAPDCGASFFFTLHPPAP